MRIHIRHLPTGILVYSTSDPDRAWAFYGRSHICPDLPRLNAGGWRRSFKDYDMTLKEEKA